jgi:hypothetical protein
MFTWIRDLAAPRHRHDAHGGTAQYRRTRTDRDAAADFIYEGLYGPPAENPVLGYMVAQGPGLPGGARSTPQVEFVYDPIIRGYVLGSVYQQRLYVTGVSAGLQENI